MWFSKLKGGDEHEIVAGEPNFVAAGDEPGSKGRKPNAMPGAAAQFPAR